jgi:hypothetical protein
MKVSYPNQSMAMPSYPKHSEKNLAYALMRIASPETPTYWKRSVGDELAHAVASTYWYLKPQMTTHH